MEMDIFLNHPGLRAITIGSMPGYKGVVFVNEMSFAVTMVKTAEGWRMTSDNDHIVQQLNAKHYQQAIRYVDAYAAHLSTLHPPHQLVPFAKYRRVLQEYREFVTFFLRLEHRQLAADFSQISATHVDEKLRRHSMTIKTNFEQGKLFAIAETDLPGVTDAEHHSLIELFQMYVGWVEAYQEFFDVMDMIDRYCWVIEPEEPRKRDVTRTVILNEHVAFVITIHPKYPTDLPNVKLLGVPDEVAKVHDVLQVCFEKWNHDGDFYDELLLFFDVAVFPQRGAFDIDIKKFL